MTNNRRNYISQHGGGRPVRVANHGVGELVWVNKAGTRARVRFDNGAGHSRHWEGRLVLLEEVSRG